ncbi:DUF6218 family protein [Lentzea sp. NPDC059081]|uniref:DUF6218 family protein n=1 Tax=Lentzea sp. NPDC059081 TaxID=3346719 RepID=UPI0036AF73EA
MIGHFVLEEREDVLAEIAEIRAAREKRVEEQRAENASIVPLAWPVRAMTEAMAGHPALRRRRVEGAA